MYSESTIAKFLFLIGDAVAVFASFFVIFFFFSYESLLNPAFNLITVGLTLLLSVASNQYSVIHHRRLLKEVVYVFVFCIEFLIAYIFVIFCAFYFDSATRADFPLRLIAGQVVVVYVLTYLIRTLVHLFSKNHQLNTKNIILVTNSKDYISGLDFLTQQNAQVVACLSHDLFSGTNYPILNSFDEVRYLLTNCEVNEVYVTNEARQLFLEEQDYFASLGIPVTICLSGMEKSSFTSATLHQYDNQTVLTYSLNQVNYRLLLIKRLFDILASLIGLIITGIVAIIIYPIVQKQSKGPLLFKQKRVGKNGKVFDIYKFRSMYLDAEERKKELMKVNELSSDHMFKMENDPRIFPFGQKLRDWSIDELPQFINVLKGDMSLIGTRPPTVEEYQKYDLHHFKRLAMKPGITGMWQVSGRSNITDFEKVVELDLSYIKNWSIWLDIKIIFKTIAVVLKREGSK